MALPQNAKEIYTLLLSIGLTPNAAAGVAGNIQRESLGNPEAQGTGGRGLIGWTPPSTLPDSAFTGNTGADLVNQVRAIARYIQANGSIADVNAHAADPASAALYFSERYERPGIPANAQREQAAQDVAAAAKSGNWKASAQLTSANQPGGFPNPLNIFGDIGGIAGAIASVGTTLGKIGDDFAKIAKAIEWFLVPSHWMRIIFFVIGAGLLVPGLNNLRHAGRGDAALAMGILEVTAAGVFLFLAFHNIPDDVKNLQELLRWVAEGIRSGKVPSALQPASSPTSAPASKSASSSSSSAGTHLV